MPCSRRLHLDSKLVETRAFKKCIILCVSGLLCFINPSIAPDRWDVDCNVVKRPSLRKLLAILVERFYVELWCTMPVQNLKPLPSFILPCGVLDRLFGREYCDCPENYLWCHKLLNTLYSKRHFNDVCKPDEVLLVNVSSLSL